MKKIVNFLICLIISIMAIGQNETQNSEVGLDESEVSPPIFTGNENGVAFPEADNSALKDYLLKGIICPEPIWEGEEIVQFTVTPSGNVTNLMVINSVCP